MMNDLNVDDPDDCALQDCLWRLLTFVDLDLRLAGCPAEHVSDLLDYGEDGEDGAVFWFYVDDFAKLCELLEAMDNLDERAGELEVDREGVYLFVPRAILAYFAEKLEEWCRRCVPNYEQRLRELEATFSSSDALLRRSRPDVRPVTQYL